MQGCVLHSFHCNVSPVQFFPPYIGVGFVHDRRLSEVPLPQGLLQNVQELQGIKLPSTKKDKISSSIIITVNESTQQSASPLIIVVGEFVIASR